jgi:hypothetical protein
MGRASKAAKIIEKRLGGQFAPGGGRIGAAPVKEKSQIVKSAGGTSAPKTAHASSATPGGGSGSIGADAKSEKTAKRYAARTKFWNKKSAEHHAKAKNASTEVERQTHLAAAYAANKKAVQAHMKVVKAVGTDHPMAKASQVHLEQISNRSMKTFGQAPKTPDPKSWSDKSKSIDKEKLKTEIKSEMKIAEQKKADQDAWKTTIPKSAQVKKLEPTAEKTAKRYAARAKFWEKKHAEAVKKAESATDPAEKKAHELEAAIASKKAHLAAKKVEKAAGADHELTKQAKQSAEQTKMKSVGAEFGLPKPNMKAIDADTAKWKEKILSEAKNITYGATISNPTPKGESHSKKVFGKSFKEAREEFASKLTDEQKSAVLSYTGSGFKSMNASLRANKGLGATKSPNVRNIDGALKKSPAPTDMMTFRGLNGAKSGLDKIKPGDEFTDHGFSSSSMSLGSSFSHKDTIMFVSIPKGYPAAPVPSLHSHEREVLLPRSTRYRVDKVEHDAAIDGVSNKKRVVHVTIIHDKANKLHDTSDQ